MAKKGGMPIYKTVEDYINNQTEDAQVLLNEIRQIIKEVVPEMEEAKNCKSALFILEAKSTEKHQLMMGAYAKYISFYPFPSTMAVFSEELKIYKQGKGSVQFPFNKSLPIDIIKRMIVHRKNELKK